MLQIITLPCSNIELYRSLAVIKFAAQWNHSAVEIDVSESSQSLAFSDIYLQYQ